MVKSEHKRYAELEALLLQAYQGTALEIKDELPIAPEEHQRTLLHLKHPGKIMNFKTGIWTTDGLSLRSNSSTVIYKELNTKEYRAPNNNQKPPTGNWIPILRHYSFRAQEGEIVRHIWSSMEESPVGEAIDRSEFVIVEYSRFKMRSKRKIKVFKKAESGEQWAKVKEASGNVFECKIQCGPQGGEYFVTPSEGKMYLRKEWVKGTPAEGTIIADGTLVEGELPLADVVGTGDPKDKKKRRSSSRDKRKGKTLKIESSSLSTTDPSIGDSGLLLNVDNGSSGNAQISLEDMSLVAAGILVASDGLKFEDTVEASGEQPHIALSSPQLEPLI